MSAGLSAQMTRVSARTAKYTLGSVGVGGYIGLILMIGRLEGKQDDTLAEVQRLKTDLTDHALFEKIARDQVAEETKKNRAELAEAHATIAELRKAAEVLAACIKNRRKCQI